MNYLLLIPAIFILACAPSFKSLQGQKIRAQSSISQNELQVSAGFRTWRTNSKMNEKAASNNLVMLDLVVNNQSQDTVMVNNISLHTEKKVYDRINYKRVSSLTKVSRAKYWFWSFLMGGVSSSSCTNGDCKNTFIPIPIGFGIGLFQFMKATNTNIEAKNELKQLEFKLAPVHPKERSSGLLYFEKVKEAEGYLMIDISKGAVQEIIKLELDKRFLRYVVSQ